VTATRPVHGLYCFAQRAILPRRRIRRMATVALYDFIGRNRDEVIRRCRASVAKRSVPPPTEAEIDHGVPLFLDQLCKELRHGPSQTDEIGTGAMEHGHELLLQGLTVSQVVHDYGDVCQSITALAVEMEAPISADDFRTLNRCLDDAIAAAVTQYGRERDQSIDGEAAGDMECLGNMARELRNAIYTARGAFEAVKSGRVGIAGPTATVVDQSLSGARDLVDRLLVKVYATRRSTEAALR